LILLDVNVVVYGHRSDAPNHGRYQEWLEATVNADAAYGVCDLVLSGFVRVVTHPRIFQQPSPLESALDFAIALRDRPNCVAVAPGARHWEIFTRLCRETGAKGNLIADAYLAARAIESGSEWIATDRDYARFGGLRWRHPLT
jgi:toxin-antitoxin system PIN domain toxin